MYFRYKNRDNKEYKMVHVNWGWGGSMMATSMRMSSIPLEISSRPQEIFVMGILLNFNLALK